MSKTTTTIKVVCVHDSCQATFELEAEYGFEPPTTNISGYIKGGFYVESPDTPDECPVCHLVYTLEQFEEIQSAIGSACDDAAKQLDAPLEPDYFDYDPPELRDGYGELPPHYPELH